MVVQLKSAIVCAYNRRTERSVCWMLNPALAWLRKITAQTEHNTFHQIVLPMQMQTSLTMLERPKTSASSMPPCCSADSMMNE